MKNILLILMTALIIFACNEPGINNGNREKPGNGGDEKPGNGGDELPNKDTVIIIDKDGWLETLFVKWEKIDDVTRYNVYYKSPGNGINNWIKIDDPLIREYQTYHRADILGIKAGTYEVQVRPVNDSGAEFGNFGDVSGIEVKPHIRTGFAFADDVVAAGNWPGAYNMDGTPRANARIIYVTEDNKNTITLGIMDNASGSTIIEHTGIGSILERHGSRFDTRPLIVRFIGRVTADGMLNLHNTGNINLGGHESGRMAPVTLEGVGYDTTAYGWGFRAGRTTRFEIRNLGFMLFRHNSDAMDIENARYVWVHHNDIFYGQQGTGDNFKGDGSVDIKISSYVTVAYNHFWDSGKVMLLGNAGTEPRGFITYHNNHFDHSDSRHPRTRVHDAHVFNNFYDNIGTYGIGATSGSSLFAESNFFRNTRRPMMISLQGTDIINGENNGTFSSDPGGIIKAYNNHMEGGTIIFSPWSASNQIQFDAYVVQNRMDAVPETVITRVGGHTYSNFDQNLPYTYTVFSPTEAKENVIRYAGRYWGGDIGTTIPFAFVQADAASGTRNAQLDNILSSYQGKLVSVQSIGGGDQGGPGDPAPCYVCGETSCTCETGGVDGNTIIYNFSEAPFNTLSTSNFAAEITVSGLTFGSGSNLLAQSASTGGYSFTHCIRTNGAASATQRYIVVPLAGPATITIFAASNNSSATTMNVTSTAASTVNIAAMPLPAWNNAVLGTPSFNSTTEGAHTVVLKAAGSARIFMIKAEYH